MRTADRTVVILLYGIDFCRSKQSYDESKFTPMLYHFRIRPQRSSDKPFALQQPFATLFDNLITVLWSVYNKQSKIQIGKTTGKTYHGTCIQRYVIGPPKPHPRPATLVFRRRQPVAVGVGILEMHESGLRISRKHR